MNHDEFRQAAHAAIEEIIAYHQNIADYPVLPSVKPGYLAPLLPSTAPQEAQPWASIQPDIQRAIVPGLTHWQSPRFMAFFPAIVTYPSMLGEMYSAAFTAPAFNWQCSPACTELETVVMDWLAQALDLPACFLSSSSTGGGGTIQGSASEAVVTCMVAARERYLHRKCEAEGLAPGSAAWDERVAFLRGRLVALSSDQAHSSTAKGARIAGTRHRAIATHEHNDFALTAADLAAALAQCRDDEGLEPYFITLSLGTTSTCAVDDLGALLASPTSPLRTSTPAYPDIWVHVDAAYAGAALVCPEYSSAYAPALAHVDSFDVNMHKWLLVNFDASCLFVRDRNDLTCALSISAAYYENAQSSTGLVTDYRDWQIPLGRRFRSLKVWFVMRAYGIAGMQQHIRRTVALGDLVHAWLRDEPAPRQLFELVGTPRFALTCFRIRPDALRQQQQQQQSGLEDLQQQQQQQQNGLEDLQQQQNGHVEDLQQTANALTKKVVDLLTERGEIFLTSSSAGGKTFIRLVSANANAQEATVRQACQLILDTAREVVDAWSEKGKQ